MKKSNPCYCYVETMFFLHWVFGKMWAEPCLQEQIQEKYFASLWLPADATLPVSHHTSTTVSSTAD